MIKVKKELIKKIKSEIDELVKLKDSPKLMKEICVEKLSPIFLEIKDDISHQVEKKLLDSKYWEKEKSNIFPDGNIDSLVLDFIKLYEPKPLWERKYTKTIDNFIDKLNPIISENYYEIKETLQKQLSWFKGFHNTFSVMIVSSSIRSFIKSCKIRDENGVLIQPLWEVPNNN